MQRLGHQTVETAVLLSFSVRTCNAFEDIQRQVIHTPLSKNPCRYLGLRGQFIHSYVRHAPNDDLYIPFDRCGIAESGYKQTRQSPHTSGSAERTHNVASTPLATVHTESAQKINLCGDTVALTHRSLDLPSIHQAKRPPSTIIQPLAANTSNQVQSESALSDVGKDIHARKLSSSSTKSITRASSARRPYSRKSPSNEHPRAVRLKPPLAKRENWQIQKEALTSKFGSTGWAPRKRLSPDALEGIRALHAQYPGKFTTPALANQFEVPAEAIRRILKSKWRPREEEVVSRRQRWDKRGERIWSKMVALGVKPPKKWRECAGLEESSLAPPVTGAHPREIC